MKNKFNILAAVGLLVLVLCGCGVAKQKLAGALYKSTPQSVPERIVGTNQIIETNIVVSILPPRAIGILTNSSGAPYAVTNQTDAPALYTNAVPVLVSVPVVAPPTTVNTYQPNAVVENLPLLAGLTGIPWADTGASVLLAGLLVVGKWWTKKEIAEANRAALAEAGAAAQANKTAEQFKIGLETVIENFETIRTAALKVPGYTAEVDHQVMDVVKTAQIMAGKDVRAIIANIVDEKTGDTIEDAPAKVPVKTGAVVAG